MYRPELKTLFPFDEYCVQQKEDKLENMFSAFPPILEILFIITIFLMIIVLLHNYI